jgi:hypothetical protein
MMIWGLLLLNGGMEEKFNNNFNTNKFHNNFITINIFITRSYYRKGEMLPYGQKLLLPLIAKYQTRMKKIEDHNVVYLAFYLFTLLKAHHNDHVSIFSVKIFRLQH